MSFRFIFLAEFLESADFLDDAFELSLLLVESQFRVELSNLVVFRIFFFALDLLLSLPFLLSGFIFASLPFAFAKLDFVFFPFRLLLLFRDPLASFFLLTFALEETIQINQVVVIDRGPSKTALWIKGVRGSK